MSADKDDPRADPTSPTAVGLGRRWSRWSLGKDTVLSFVAGAVAGFVVLVGFYLVRDERAPAPILGPPAAAVRLSGADAGPWTVFGRRVAGRVVSAGQPVAGARVLLAEAGAQCEDRVAVVEVRTELDGRFEFGVRPAQLYLVAATAPGRAMGIVELDLRDPEEQPEVEVALGACEHAILGTVVSAARTPIGGATIREDGLLGVVAGADGSFALCVSHHRPDVLVSAPGFATALVTPLLNGPNRVEVTLVAQASVSGLVLGPDDDRPVFGARVRATPPPIRRLSWSRSRGPRCTGPRPLRFAIDTDEQGRFRLDGLDPGPWTLTAEAPGHSGGDSAEVELAGGRSIGPTLLRLGPAATTLHGMIFADGQPVASIPVLAVDRTTGATSREAITQADGSFVLEQVPRGTVAIVSPHHQIVPDREIDTVLVGAGIITANLRHGEAIAGQVRFGGRPVAAELRIDGLPAAHTRWDGRFVVRLPSAADAGAGSYSVRAVSRELAAASEITEVTMAAGGRHGRADLALEPAGEIAGTVLDGPSNAPLESLLVSCESRDGGEQRVSATGPGGAFRCPLLVREGAYVLQVLAPGSSDPLPPARGAHPIVVLPSARARVDKVALVVRTERTVLAGRVLDDAGQPVADARVVAWQPRPRTRDDRSGADLAVSSAPAAFTGPDGGFELQTLTSGPWELRATTPAGGSGFVAGVTGPRSGLVLRARPAAAIVGQLAEFSRIPRVSVRSLADDWVIDLEVRGRRFAARALPPGRYLVRADTPTEGADARVEVAPGQSFELVLTSGGQGSLRGRVVDRSTGEPVPAVWCEAGLHPHERALPQQLAPGMLTDDQGRFVLAPVPAGEVEVRCWGDAMPEATARVRVRRDAAAEVEVRAAIDREP